MNLADRVCRARLAKIQSSLAGIKGTGRGKERNGFKGRKGKKTEEGEGKGKSHLVFWK